jgi:hypothetical protein
MCGLRMRGSTRLGSAWHIEKKDGKQWLLVAKVGHNHTHVRIYGVYMVFLIGELPYIRSYTVYIHGSGQPYS